MRRVLGSFTVLGMQTPEYARRMTDLGAPADRVTVTGSVKFDGAKLERDEAAVQRLLAQLGIGAHERVLLAGSTHAPEEEAILDAYAELAAEFPDLRLLIAPRHQERFDEVAALIESKGWGLQRRSGVGGDTPHPGTPWVPLPRLTSSVKSERFAGERGKSVVLLDTLGELSACWPLAEVAFVGGSLSQRGGQNMLEPCAAGAAVIVGPNTWNFKQAVELLTAAGGLFTVSSRGELTAAIRRLLLDRFQAETMRAAARRAIASQQGATRTTVDLLLRRLQDVQIVKLANRRAA